MPCPISSLTLCALVLLSLSRLGISPQMSSSRLAPPPAHPGAGQPPRARTPQPASPRADSALQPAQLDPSKPQPPNPRPVPAVPAVPVELVQIVEVDPEDLGPIPVNEAVVHRVKFKSRSAAPVTLRVLTAYRADPPGLVQRFPDRAAQPLPATIQIFPRAAGSSLGAPHAARPDPDVPWVPCSTIAPPPPGHPGPWTFTLTLRPEHLNSSAQFASTHIHILDEQARRLATLPAVDFLESALAPPRPAGITPSGQRPADR